jgi:DNA-directed RNA polymerase specialized sigma24 family protein
MNLAVVHTTDSYKYLHQMLERMAARYVYLYGYDFEEVMQEACVGFLLAHVDYNWKKQASFRSWVYTKVSKRLLDYHRKQTKARQLKGKEQEVYDPWNPFWLFEFLDGLGEDAKTVVQIVLESPQELRYAIKSKGKYNPKPRDIRSAINDVLADIGWTAQRVRDTFTEIRRNLK